MTQADPNNNPSLLIAQVHRWRTAFFGLVVLLAGVVIGAGAVLIWAAPRTVRTGPRQGAAVGPDAGAMPAEVLVQRLRRSLQLSTQQVQAIRPIVREHMANLNRIRQETRPKVADQLRLMGQRIEGHLNRAQRPLWDQQFRRLQEQLQWSAPGSRGRVQEPRGPASAPLGRQGRAPGARSAQPGPREQRPAAPPGGPEGGAPVQDAPAASE